MKNLKFNTKKIKAIMMLSTSLILSGCSKNDDDKKKIIEVLSETKDTTYFDEIMTEEEINNVYSIEEYLELSENLNEKKFTRVEDANIEVQSLLNPIEIRGNLYLYDNKDNLSKKNLEHLEKTLTIQEKLVNKYIYDSYNNMEIASIVALKTELLTIKGLDETSYNTITIPGIKESGLNNPESSYIYIDEYKVPRNSPVSNLLQSVYKMQQKGETASNPNPDKESYNASRNKFISDAINNIKIILKENYAPNDKKILKKVK